MRRVSNICPARTCAPRHQLITPLSSGRRAVLVCTSDASPLIERLVSFLNYHMDGDARMQNSTIAAAIDASSDLVLGSTINQ